MVIMSGYCAFVAARVNRRTVALRNVGRRFALVQIARVLAPADNRIGRQARAPRV